MKNFERFTFLVAVVAVTLNLSAAAATDPLLAEGSVTIERVPAYPEGISPDPKLTWLTHRGGWQVDAYASRFDPFHEDELIYDTRRGLEAEFELLNRMGPFTFVQDFGKPEQLAAAAVDNDGSFAIINTVSPIAVRQYGVENADDMAEYLLKQLAIKLEYPNALRYDGKLVFMMFNIGSLETPEEWRQVLDRLRAAAPEEDILFVFQRSVMVTNPDYLKKMGEVFDGLIIWAGPLEAKLRQKRQYREAMAELGKPARIFWGVSNGYWRPEKGWYHDPEGTATLRKNLEIALSEDFAGIMVESWNDFEEHTFILPSREHGSVFYDLLSYYAARSTGASWTAEGPGLYLSARKEIMPGETLPLELLVLPVSKEAPRRVRLLLENEAGEPLYRSSELSFAPDAAEAVRFGVPTRALARERLLVPKLVVDGHTRDTGTWVRMAPSLPKDPWWRYVTLAEVLPMDGVSFSVDGAAPGGMIEPGRARRSVRLAETEPEDSRFRLDAYRNDTPVVGADFERRVLEAIPTERRFSLMLDFRMPMRYQGETQNRGGRLILPEGAGEWVAGVERYGHDIVVSKRVLRWKAGGDRKALVQALADLEDRDAPIRLEIPAVDFETTFTADELEAAGELQFRMTEHSTLYIRPTERPVGFPESIAREPVDLETTISARNESWAPEYYALKLDGDLGIGRSLPVLLDRPGPAQPYWFWDAAAGERFAADEARSRILDLRWRFREGGGVSALPEGRFPSFGFDLGGAFHRAGGFNPDGVPSWIEGGGLSFDGDDLMLLRANRFPRGAFRMEMELALDRLDRDQVLAYSQNRFDLRVTPEGAVRLAVTGQPNKPEAVSEPGVFPFWKPVELHLSHDFKSLKVSIDGQTVVDLPHATHWNGPALTLVVGQKARGTQIWNYEDGMRGTLERFGLSFGHPADHDAKPLSLE